MKIYGLLFIGLLSLLWGYFSWKYLNVETIDSQALIILLAGMFVFGILFGKIPLLGNSTSKQNVSYTGENYSNSTTHNYIPEIETLVEEKETMSFEEVEKDNNHFSHFEDIQDNTFLNIANNIKKQDLKIIEGIGPKIEKLLNKGGIYSYRDLEQSSINNIKSILESAGSRYTMHNPSTWGKQASIANSGDFDSLKLYQDKLNKGIEVS